MEHLKAFFTIPGAGILALGVAVLLLVAGGGRAAKPLLVGGLAGMLGGLAGSVVLALFYGLVLREGGIPSAIAPLAGFVLLLVQWLGPAAGLVVGHRAVAASMAPKGTRW